MFLCKLGDVPWLEWGSRCWERDGREIRRKGYKVGGPGTVGKWGERGCEMDFGI